MCNGKYMSDSAVEQRLRRFCTRRKSGHVPCGEEILKRWEGEQRGDLIETFKRCDLNKAQPILEQYYISYLFLLSLKNLFPSPLPSLCQGELKRQITQLVREESAKQIKVKCGWYTERAMKETLKMAKCNSQKYNSTFQAFIKLYFIPKNIGM